MRHASWSKLLSTLLALQLDYEYVCYIDSDCIFKDFDHTIEDFIQLYSDKDVLFLNDKPASDTLPCAGFYICKVHEATKQFLQNWYNVNLPEKDTEHAWEQSALHTIYQSYSIGIIDSWMFREKEGQFLRHIGSHYSKDRIPYFTSFLQSKDIDYAKNIHAIQCIEFDTNTGTDYVFFLSLFAVVFAIYVCICLYAGTWNGFEIVRKYLKQLGLGKRRIL
jgi:hypothetical protein